jgi:endonuclease/exonuclease/phosphatase (EEP) superfamily protein YafD
VRKAATVPRPTTRDLLALAVTLPWLAWAVVRTFGLDSGRVLVPAISFTPYVAGTAWIPIAVALLLRRRAVALVALAPAVALVVAVAPRALDGPAPAVAGGTRLDVLTVNLRYGNADPRAVMSLVDRYDVDLLSLQEMPPSAVAALDAAGARRRFPHRVLDARPGAEGTGIMARYPLTDPARPAGLRMAMPEATLRMPGVAPIRVKAVHPVAPLRADVAVWREGMRSLPRATPGGAMRILVGDFNATLDHRELRDVISSGYTDAADATGQGLRGTYPARRRVRIAIDHVLVDRRAEVTDAGVHLVRGSDHRAVTATIRLPALRGGDGGPTTAGSRGS